MNRVFASLLAGLLLAVPLARAELRGKVHMLVNPEAPRADWRRVPLPGAYIAVLWSVTVPAPAHAISTCRYGELARSDEKGEYAMEGPGFVTTALAKPSFLVYSPGLESVRFPYGGSPQSEKDITMARSALPPQERLSRLAVDTHLHCADAKLNDPHGLLGAYHRALLDEGRSLQVESPSGRIQLQHLEAVARRAASSPPPGQ